MEKIKDSHFSWFMKQEVNIWWIMSSLKMLKRIFIQLCEVPASLLPQIILSIHFSFFNVLKVLYSMYMRQKIGSLWNRNQCCNYHEEKNNEWAADNLFTMYPHPLHCLCNKLLQAFLLWGMTVQKRSLTKKNFILILGQQKYIFCASIDMLGHSLAFHFRQLWQLT